MIKCFGNHIIQVRDFLRLCMFFGVRHRVIGKIGIAFFFEMVKSVKYTVSRKTLISK